MRKRSSRGFPQGYRGSLTRFIYDYDDELSRDAQIDYIFSECNLMPLQRKNELKRLLDILQERKPKVILETGTDKGGSFFTWCKHLPVEKAIGIEKEGTPFDKEFREYFPNIEFLLLHKGTDEDGVYDAVGEFLGKNTIDFVFLDGAKMFGIIRDDFNSLLPYMSENGIIAIHDINPRGDDVAVGPIELFDKCVNMGFRTEEIIDIIEANSFLEEKREPNNAYEDWLGRWGDTSAGIGVIYMDKEMIKWSQLL